MGQKAFPAISLLLSNATLYVLPSTDAPGNGYGLTVSGAGTLAWTQLASVAYVDSGLSGKANFSHTHAQSDITNLTTDLAAKASTSYVDAGLATKASSSHTHAQSDITNLATDLAAKQATLVSGTNIKTINGSSVLGSGDLVVSGGIGGSTGATDNRVLRSDGTGGATAQNSAVTIDDSGNVSGVATLAVSSGSITASTPNSIAQTWNSSGVTFVGLSLAITDTASANGSKALQIGSSTAEISVKKVASASNHTAAFRLVFGDSISLAYSPEYGKLTVRNGTNTGDAGILVAEIQSLGALSAASNCTVGSHVELCSTSWRGGSHRAITIDSNGGIHWSSTTAVSGTPDVGFNRNAAGVVEVNSGTVGTYRDMMFRNLTLTGLHCVGTYTVATLPSASSNAGKEAQVTDSSVTTYRSTVSGGGANRAKVFSDGTNWLVN